jgi:hypothetical protein
MPFNRLEVEVFSDVGMSFARAVGDNSASMTRKRQTVLMAYALTAGRDILIDVLLPWIK